MMWGTVCGLAFCGLTALAEEEPLTDTCDSPAAMQARTQAEWEQAVKARQDFAAQVGMTESDLRAMMRAKMQRGRLVESLRRQAEELAIALQTPEADGELIQSKVEAYVKLRDETSRQLQEIDRQLLEQTDAKNRPKVLGALLVAGAVDNGIVSLCPTQSALAGGVGNALRPPQVGAMGPRAQMRPRFFVPQPNRP
jgi:predicted transcriptional regulator